MEEEPQSSLSTFTEAQKVEHLTSIIVHAASCQDENCAMTKCLKMKKILAHCILCSRRQRCPVCKQVIAVSCLHAKDCSDKWCKVPFCAHLRNRMEAYRNRRQFEKTQSTEDDPTLSDPQAKCLICLSDKPERPLGCVECKQLIGCGRCVSRWFFTNYFADISASTSEPPTEGRRNCPLCRARWDTRKKLAPYHVLKAKSDENVEPEEKVEETSQTL